MAENIPPGANPLKGKYMRSDLQFLSKMYDIPMTKKMPSNFPLQSLLPMRTLCAIKLHQPGELLSCTQALFRAFWFQDKNVAEEQVIRETLAPFVDVEKIMSELVKTPEVKQMLTDNTSRMFKNYGAFGMPWMVAYVDGKERSFWGSDRIEAMAYFLQLQYTDHETISKAKL